MAVQGATNPAAASTTNPYATRETGSTREVPQQEARDNRGRDRDYRGPGINLSSLISPLPGGVSRSQGGEALADANATLAELIKNGTWNNGLDIRLFPVDHSSLQSLKISAIVIAVRLKGALEAGVAYHTMILAASAGIINPKRLKIDNREVELIRTADNGNDSIMIDVVEKLIVAAYPGVHMLPVPATTVPTLVNLKDAGQVNRLLVNGLLGCITYLQENAGGRGVASLKEMSNHMKFVTALSYDHVPLVNDAQLPVRNDFSITLSSTPVQVMTDTLDLNDGTDGKEIMNVRGFVDLAWTEGPDQDDARYDSRRQHSTAHYIPRIITTSVYTGDNSYIALIAIALGMLNALRNNTAWMQAMPMATKPGDLSDYGILSLETPIDPQNPRVLAPTPFRSDDEGRAMYHDFLRRMVMATPQLCIDVPMCGPETWQLGFLIDIASGDPVARQMFIDTINQLTDNKFGDNLAEDDWLMRLDSEVHLGTYRNAAGEIRDMREIGYVQMANAALPLGNGPNNPLQVWSASWAERDRDIALRLDDRLRTQTSFFGAMNVTGMAQRLECSSGLLDGIAQAFAGSSFHPLMTGFKSQLDSYGRASFRGHTMGAGHAADLFRRPSSDNGSYSAARYGGRGHRYGNRG